MRWTHPAHPGRVVRLAYCMNVHAGETLEELRAGIEEITLPLRDRLAGGRLFGVGAYVPNAVATRLASDAGAAELDELAAFFAGEGLAAFTFNAFPYGGFHADGLKERVYSPTWAEAERESFTLAVAEIATRLAPADAEHVSISTHPGTFGAWVDTPQVLHACAQGMARVVARLVEIAQDGPRVVLSVEAEPRASANDSAALAEYLAVARVRASAGLAEGRGVDAAQAQLLAARHLGTCLDCCHSAVEFEAPERAWALAHLGGSLGKVQFSSALSLRAPGDDAAGRAALLEMDEPRYLHQVTGRGPTGKVGVSDLPELASLLASSGHDWLACEEWRCHFHVPVDLEAVGGLETTRAHADRVLDCALADVDSWTSAELHLEIETYTWDVLPGAARGAGALVDGLEREYEHVLGRLEAAGWARE